MKILHYIPSIDEESGGVGAYMQLLTRDLGKLCELHVVTHKSDKMRELENCNLHFIPDNVNPLSGIGKSEFMQLLNRINPDVFHSNCCWRPMSAWTALWAKKAGYKVVYTPHGMLEPWIMKRHYWTRKIPAILMFQKKGVLCVDLVHATAESEKENLLHLGWNKNVVVIGNCVQVDQIPMKESWNRKKSILFLSRVHVKKGINFLIEAVAELKEELKDYTVNIAGPGEESYFKELIAQATHLGLNVIREGNVLNINDSSPTINFVGSVFGDVKFKMFRDADMFVLPTHSENFGIVVTEALASGTPVITTKGTPWHELETCHCGWWTEIGTQPLIRALKQFLQCSEDKLEDMGHNGRKLVEEQYSSEAIAGQFIRLYESLTHGL